MRTAVINTGTELLLGNTVNTHLAHIARRIFPLGLRVAEQISVPDGDPISETLRAQFQRAELIFLTGGLGPTSDDVTREITADLLGLPLLQDESIAEAIRARAKLRGFPLPERVFRQALVPEGAVVLPNENGTAPGLYLRKALSPRAQSPHLFLLPGPPRELYPMLDKHVMPIIEQIAPPGAGNMCRVYTMAGTGESIVEEAVGAQLLELPLELGYCARAGEVEVRLIGPGAALSEADHIIRRKLDQYIFTTAGESLEQVVVEQLRQRGETVVVAESCTGGALAHRFTNVPGSSAVFRGGLVVYSNEMKTEFLGVPAAIIREHGAVSEPVAMAMADRARVRTASSYALATTGIAGPGGATENKPVGTIFIALAAEEGPTICGRFNFSSDRETFKQLATQTALNLLRLRLRHEERA